MKLESMCLASSVLIDGVEQTFLTADKVDFTYLDNMNAWLLTGKKYGHQIIVYPTNVKWARIAKDQGVKVESSAVSSRSRKGTSET